MENIRNVRATIREGLGRLSGKPFKIATAYHFPDDGRILAEHTAVLHGAGLAPTRGALSGIRSTIRAEHGGTVGASASKADGGVVVSVVHTARVPPNLKEDVQFFAAFNAQHRKLKADLVSKLKKFERK